MKPRRPVLAGNNEAGVLVLDLLLEEWSPADVLVIAPPGGAKHGWQPSLAAHAEAAGVRVIAPAKVNDDEVVGELKAHGCDLLLSVYYTQLFREPFLEAIEGPAVNFHPSLLPRHRGNAPLIWAIADGDEMTGLSVHQLDLGIDTGPLLWQEPLPIHPDDTGYLLHRKAARLVQATAADLLRRLVSGRPLPEPKEQSGPSSQHSSRDPQLNLLDWRDPGERIRNVVRALAAPLPGAHTTWRDQRIGVEKVEVLPATGAPLTPGMVASADADRGVVVWAGDGPVRLVDVRLDDEVQPAGVLAGRGVREGELLG